MNKVTSKTEFDFNFLVTCALRYAITKDTYAMHDISSIITSRIDELSNVTKIVLMNDLKKHLDKQKELDSHYLESLFNNTLNQLYLFIKKHIE